MKDIGAVTIGKLIEAHYEKNENKFKAYAEFIAEAYKERGEERAERIIRSKIDRSYKNKSVAVTLDNERKEELKDEMKNKISMALKDPILQQGFEIICKENAELKARLFCTKETCDNCGFVKCENFQRQRKSDPCSVYISYKDRITKLKLQLTKAKEIIEELSKSLFLAKGIVRDLIDDTVDFKESKERATYCYEQEKFDTYKKAVQFLNSEVEKRQK